MNPTYDLATRPEGAVFHSGVAELTRLDGRAALRVSLTEQMTRCEMPGGGCIDLPTFIALPIWFEDGMIEVEVHSRLDEGAPDSAKPLAGLAYRIGSDRDQFEAVEVRPLNGTPGNPASARARRAAQYFAYPDWPFDRLGPVEPSWPGGDLLPDSWTRITLYIDGTRLTALVDGVEALVIPVTRAATLQGDIGLFVDVGTEAHFANLQVMPA